MLRNADNGSPSLDGKESLFSGKCSNYAQKDNVAIMIAQILNAENGNCVISKGLNVLHDQMECLWLNSTGKKIHSPEDKSGTTDNSN